MDKQAQEFMNINRITECFECDGVLFKHRENADARKVVSGKELIVHSLSAGKKTKKSEE